MHKLINYILPGGGVMSSGPAVVKMYLNFKKSIKLETAYDMGKVQQEYSNQCNVAPTPKANHNVDFDS